MADGDVQSTIKRKICVVGAYGVGKTDLVRNHVSSIMDKAYHAALGVKVDSKTVQVGDQQVQLMIWDIAGAEDYFTVPMSYVRGSRGCLLVVDGTHSQTVERGMDIVRQITEELGELPVVVMVNNADLVDRFQLTDDVLAPIHSMNWPIIRCNAKTGEGVEDAFLELAKRLLT